MNGSGGQLQASTIQGLVKDMRLVGLFNIIYGALSCLSIIGAVTGIPLIIAGIRCRESAESMTNYLGSQDVGALNRALEEQKSYFNLNKIVFIIQFVLVILFIAFYAALFGAIISGAFDPADF